MRPYPLLLALLSHLIPPIPAFPLHFPPSSFTDATPITPAEIALLRLADPGNAIAWPETNAPSILLCSAAWFRGDCQILEHNAPQTCLNLKEVREKWSGWEVGSVKIGGSAGCVLYDRQACTGATVAVLAKDTVPDLAALSQFDHSSVMSLFCEPLRDFTPWDAGASVQKPSLLAASRDRRRRWRRTVRKDTKPSVDDGGKHQSGVKMLASPRGQERWP